MYSKAIAEFPFVRAYQADPNTTTLKLKLEPDLLPAELRPYRPQIDQFLAKHPTEQSMLAALKASSAETTTMNQGRAILALLIGLASAGIGVLAPAMASFMRDDGWTKRAYAVLIGAGWTGMVAGSAGLPLALVAGTALGVAAVVMPEDGVDPVENFKKAALEQYQPEPAQTGYRIRSVR